MKGIAGAIWHGRRNVDTGMAGGRRILLVEDDPEIAEMIGEILGHEGYRLTTVATERHALAVLAGARYDLVLTDALAEPAPDEERWTVVERLLAAAEGVPVVICTAHDPRHFADFAARGFSGLIVKPFDLDDLLQPIARLLASPRPDMPRGAGGISAE